MKPPANRRAVAVMARSKWTAWRPAPSRRGDARDWHAACRTTMHKRRSLAHQACDSLSHDVEFRRVPVTRSAGETTNPARGCAACGIPCSPRLHETAIDALHPHRGHPSLRGHPHGDRHRLRRQRELQGADGAGVHSSDILTGWAFNRHAGSFPRVELRGATLLREGTVHAPAATVTRGSRFAGEGGWNLREPRLPRLRGGHGKAERLSASATSAATSSGLADCRCKVAAWSCGRLGAAAWLFSRSHSSHSLNTINVQIARA